MSNGLIRIKAVESPDGCGREAIDARHGGCS